MAKIYEEDNQIIIVLDEETIIIEDGKIKMILKKGKIIDKSVYIEQ